MADSEFFEHTSDEIADKAPVADEYEAGYRSRLEGEAEFRTATCTGEPAGRMLIANFCERNLPWIPKNDALTSEQWSLYGTGAQARACELPFDTYPG